MSLRTDRGEIESHATALEQEADALERDLGAVAAAQVEADMQSPTAPEALAAMKPAEPEDSVSPETSETSPDAVMTQFQNRAQRLRELAATLSTDDRELLLTIAAEYEELAKILARRPDPDPT